MPDEIASRKVSRRELLRRAGVGAGSLAVSGSLAGPIWTRPRVADAGNTIKIGFVSPITGATAGFGEPDGYVIGTFVDTSLRAYFFRVKARDR